MIVERALNDQYLSNSFVVGDEPGGSAVIIDAGGPVEPLVDAVEANDLNVTHLLCTHHHIDHVSHNDFFVEKYGCPVFVPAAEADLFTGPYDETIEDQQLIETGSLAIVALHTPGHTKGMLAFVIASGGAGTALSAAGDPAAFGGAPIEGEAGVFTGDTLFKGTVGGTLAPGHSTYADLKNSIMITLMGLPHEMTVYPGHTDFTTIGEEWENNPFIRIWRGVDEARVKPCTIKDEPAELILRATDYDGGTKCWVRYPDGTDQVAPGSWVIDAE